MEQAGNGNTRARLLDEAERLFATKGFEAVSIREITGAAQSNVAAVNYHFGSKENLYLAVFRERWVQRTRRIWESFSSQLAGQTKPAAKDIINALARTFLDGPLSDSERRYQAQLMQRELAHPGPALKMVVTEVMKPHQKQVGDLLRPHLPADVNEDRLRLYVLSIFGMTLHFTFARPAVSMITRHEYDSHFKYMLIDHITAFALNGLDALKGGA